MPNGRISPTDQQLGQLARITSALGEISLCLPGSVAVRSYRCGKVNCVCHAEPPRLHGPYIQWSRRVGAKTAHTNLTAEAYEEYRPLFENAARLRSLVNDLEALSLAIIGDDPGHTTSERPAAGPEDAGPIAHLGD